MAEKNRFHMLPPTSSSPSRKAPAFFLQSRFRLLRRLRKSIEKIEIIYKVRFENLRLKPAKSKRLEDIFATCAQLFGRIQQIIRIHGIPVTPLGTPQSRNVDRLDRFHYVVDQPV